MGASDSKKPIKEVPQKIDDMDYHGRIILTKNGNPLKSQLLSGVQVDLTNPIDKTVTERCKLTSIDHYNISKIRVTIGKFRFTIYQERRSKGIYWVARKRVKGKLQSSYIGKQITPDKLLRARDKFT